MTPRGAATGNYGQAMPLNGGVLLNLIEMNQIASIAPGRVVAEPGALLIDIDSAPAASGPGTAHVPFDPGDRERSAASSPAARAASARSPGAACAISAM